MNTICWGKKAVYRHFILGENTSSERGCLLDILCIVSKNNLLERGCLLGILTENNSLEKRSFTFHLIQILWQQSVYLADYSKRKQFIRVGYLTFFFIINEKKNQCT